MADSELIKGSGGQNDHLMGVWQNTIAAQGGAVAQGNKNREKFLGYAQKQFENPADFTQFTGDFDKRFPLITEEPAQGAGDAELQAQPEKKRGQKAKTGTNKTTQSGDGNNIVEDGLYSVLTGVESSVSDVTKAASIGIRSEDPDSWRNEVAGFFDGISDSVDGWFPEPSAAFKEQNPMASSFLQSFGQMAGVLGTTLATGGVGGVAQVGVKGAAIATTKMAATKAAAKAMALNVAKRPGAFAAQAVVSGSGIAVDGVEEYRKHVAKAGGEVDLNTEKKMLASGMMLGALTEMIPTGRLANRMLKNKPAILRNLSENMMAEGVARKLGKGVANRIEDAAIEGVTEGVQGLGMNALASAIYDADKGLLDDVAKQAAEGGAMGALFGLILPGRKGGNVEMGLPTDIEIRDPLAPQIDPGALREQLLYSTPSFARTQEQNSEMEVLRDNIHQMPELARLYEESTGVTIQSDRNKLDRLHEVMLSDDATPEKVTRHAQDLFGGKASTAGFSEAISNIMRDTDIIYDPEGKGHDTGISNHEFISSLGDPNSPFYQKVGKDTADVIQNAIKGKEPGKNADLAAGVAVKNFRKERGDENHDNIVSAVRSGNIASAITAVDAAHQAATGDKKVVLGAAKRHLQQIQNDGAEAITVSELSPEARAELDGHLVKRSEASAVTEGDGLVQGGSRDAAELEATLKTMEDSGNYGAAERGLAVKNVVVSQQIKQRFGTPKLTQQFLSRNGINEGRANKIIAERMSSAIERAGTIGEKLQAVRKAVKFDTGDSELTTPLISPEKTARIEAAIDTEFTKLKKIYDADSDVNGVDIDATKLLVEGKLDEKALGDMSADLLGYAGYSSRDSGQMLQGMGVSKEAAQQSEARLGFGGRKPDPRVADYFRNPNYKERAQTKAEANIKATIIGTGESELVNIKDKGDPKDKKSDSKIINGVRYANKTYQRWLTSGTAIDDKTGGAEIIREAKDANAHSQHAKTEALADAFKIRDLQRKVLGREGTLTPAQSKIVFDYVNGGAEPRFPKLRRIGNAYRQVIDRQSAKVGAELVKTTNYMASLETDYGVDTSQIVSKIDTIQANFGKYTNRSYNAFDKPLEYAKAFRKDEAKMLSTVDQILREDYNSSADPEVRERAGRDLEAALINIESSAGDEFAFFDKVVTSADASSQGIMKKRKEMPDWLLNVLDADTDITTAVYRTLSKQGQLVEGLKSQRHILQYGVKSGIISTDAHPGADYAQMEDAFTNGISILDNFYVQKDAKQAILDFGYNKKVDPGLQMVSKINRWIKKALTIHNPGSHVRNELGARINLMRNGILSVDDHVQGAQMYAEIKKEHAKGKLSELHSFMIKAHIIGDNVHTAEIDSINQALGGPDENLSRLTNRSDEGLARKWFEKLDRLDDAITDVYKGYDERAKVTFFMSEFRKATTKYGMTKEQAMDRARERTLALMPSPSESSAAIRKVRAPKTARDFGASLVVNPFVTFSSEQLRTMKNAIKLSHRDAFYGESAAIRKDGFYRMGALSGSVAIQAGVAGAFMGADDEDEPMNPEGYQRSLAEYDKRSLMRFEGIEANNVVLRSSQYTMPDALGINVMDDMLDFYKTGDTEQLENIGLNALNEFVGASLTQEVLKNVGNILNPAFEGDKGDELANIGEKITPKQIQTLISLWTLGDDVPTAENNLRWHNKFASQFNANMRIMSFEQMFTTMGKSSEENVTNHRREALEHFYSPNQSFDANKVADELRVSGQRTLDETKDMIKQSLTLFNGIRGAGGDISPDALMEYVQKGSGLKKSVVEGMLMAHMQGTMDEITIDTPFENRSGVFSFGAPEAALSSFEKDVNSGKVDKEMQPIILKRFKEVANVYRTRIYKKSRAVGKQ